eukprot:1161811-Pelagomonas_calceolata.AAC.1
MPSVFATCATPLLKACTHFHVKLKSTSLSEAPQALHWVTQFKRFSVQCGSSAQSTMRLKHFRKVSFNDSTRNSLPKDLAELSFPNTGPERLRPCKPAVQSHQLLWPADPPPPLPQLQLTLATITFFFHGSAKKTGDV